MADLMYFPTNLLFFGIPLLYYYANFNLSIICYLSWGDMYLFLGLAISTSFSFVSTLLCNSLEGFFETLVILSAILLLIKSPVVSAVFWIAFFEAAFIPSVVDH